MNETAVLPLTDIAPKSQLNDVLTKLKDLSVGDEKKQTVPLEDEYSNRDKVTILTPNDDHLSKSSSYQKVVNGVRKDMEYYSRTKKLETDTPRVKFLQDALDKMLEGTDHKGRVVIMNKGEIPDAHVYPEGTVFISQSLISKLDTVDELIAVLAHEAGHIINGTFFKSMTYGTNALTRLGVGSVHEVAGDHVNAFAILEKLGYNTTALSTAFLKIGNAGDRGTVHQSLLTRASQNVGMHYLFDTATSSKPQEPLEESVWKLPAEKTHADQLREIAKTLDYEKMRELLPKLHERDFQEAFKICHLGADGVRESDVKRDDLLDLSNKTALVRLHKAGYSTEEIDLFFICAQETLGTYAHRSYNMIQNPEQVVAMTEKIADFYYNRTYRAMQVEIFMRSKDLDENYEKPPDLFLNALAHFTYNPDGRVNKRGIPLTEDKLFNVLNTLIHSPTVTVEEQHARGHNALLAIATYAVSTYVKDDGSFDADEVLQFINRVKAADFPHFVPFLYQPDSQLEHTLRHNSLKSQFIEAFGVKPVEKEPETAEQLIDRLLNKFNEYKRENFDDLLCGVKQLIHDESADNARKLALVRYLAAKIDALTLEGTLPLRNYLESPRNLSRPRVENAEEIEFNRQLIKLRLKTVGAMAFFGTDVDEFYTFLDKSLETAKIDFSQFSLNQLVEFNNPFFQDGEPINLFCGYAPTTIHDFRKDHFRIQNYERFKDVPFMQEMIKKIKPVQADSLKEFEKVRGGQSEVSRTWEIIVRNLYSDRFECLLLGVPYREAFSHLLNKGIKPDEYSYSYGFIKNCYPASIEREELAREINKVYLQRKDIPLADRLNHLLFNFDELGPEGMIIVAEQISSPAEYLQFRERMKGRISEYLKGGKAVIKVALADYLSSELTHRFEDLFESSKNDPETQDKISTSVAIQWADAMFRGEGGVVYDRQSGKATATSQGRSLFRSFTDLVQEVKSLSSLKRLAIAQKALTDSGGALTTSENRKKLGVIINESLDIASPFVRAVLQLGCERIKPEFLSFPVARMLAPLLFRALDLEAVRVDELEKFKLYANKRFYPDVDTTGSRNEYVELTKIIPEDRLVFLMTSDTRSALLFGSQYRNQPEGKFATMVVSSDNQYGEIRSWLQHQFIIEKTEEDEAKNILDPGTEAVIRGIEGSSALGVRSLQIARQLHKFSEPVARRLDQSFDANPGLNKLLFWENLYRIAEQKGGEEIKQFIEEKLISIDNYLGGGSLYTTYGAVIKGENGEPRKVVLKMLNPNATLFIGESYTAAHGILETIAESEASSEADRLNANMGKTVVDLANKWCVNDINDPTFVEDDDRFRQTITAFKAGEGGLEFYAPERTFNSFKLKSEDEAEGRTLNKVLKDEAVPAETKQKIISRLHDFMLFQLTVPTEESDFIVHSDPHVGNYMIDMSGEAPRIGVIDRSMYLKFAKEDVDVLRPLLESQDYRHFAYSLIQRMLDVNKVRGTRDRVRVTTNIMGKLISEYAKQKLSGKSSNFELFRILNAELSSRDMEVPLEMQLMVRNIAALVELQKKYE